MGEQMLTIHLIKLLHRRSCSHAQTICISDTVFPARPSVDFAGRYIWTCLHYDMFCFMSNYGGNVPFYSLSCSWCWLVILSLNHDMNFSTPALRALLPCHSSLRTIFQSREDSNNHQPVWSCASTLRAPSEACPEAPTAPQRSLMWLIRPMVPLTFAHTHGVTHTSLVCDLLTHRWCQMFICWLLPSLKASIIAVRVEEETETVVCWVKCCVSIFSSGCLRGEMVGVVFECVFFFLGFEVCSVRKYKLGLKFCSEFRKKPSNDQMTLWKFAHEQKHKFD